MIEKKNEKLGVSFKLPDPETVTVRKQMAYLSEASFAFDRAYFERLWRAALVLIEDFQCDLIPSVEKLDIDKETNPKITEIVFWVGWETKLYFNGLDSVPKN